MHGFGIHGRQHAVRTHGPAGCGGAPKGQAGVSLTESIIGLAVLAILAGSAIGSWGRQAEETRLRGRAEELMQDLHWARSEAVSRGESVRWSLPGDTGSSACYVIHTGPSGSCQCNSPAGQNCAQTARLLKVVSLEAHEGLQISSTSRSMLWSHTTGTVTPAGSVSMEHSDLGQIRVVVSMMGRVRSCSPGARIAGHPSC